MSGVPVNLRLVNVTINRAGFTFNPTSCNAMEVTGSMTGGQGATAALASHFQVTNCGGSVQAEVHGGHVGQDLAQERGEPRCEAVLSQERDGQVREHPLGQGQPAQTVPSRLTTLQKACLDSVFGANPAACPAGSKVGGATATTPLLPGVLVGPAYFVSHGGAKFPELIIVLQGDGVTVDLHGETFIRKAGITSSTFRQVPDVPVNTFELKLPQGPNSALAANGNLCESKLAMPTMFTAQNGLQIKQSTRSA